MCFPGGVGDFEQARQYDLYQMTILMLSQAIGSIENGNDDDEPGNRIFFPRCPKWCTVGDFEQKTLKTLRNSMGVDKHGDGVREKDDYS